MIELLDNIWQFFNDIPTFINSVFIQISSWIVIWKLKLMAGMAQYSWEVAKAVIDNLNISSMIDTAWGNIDSNLLQLLTFFRIPEALNIILNSYFTKVTLRVLFKA